MLKSFPEHALAHARDGVIAPSALGLAARADLLESTARRRATRLLDALPAQVASATAQARTDGFCQGYAEAMAEAVPLLAAALDDVQAMRAAVLGQVREVIRASLEAEGIDAALVVRRCEQLLQGAEAGLVLYVPEQMPALGDAVLAQLADTSKATSMSVVSSRSTLPMLGAGALLFELDPAGAIATAVEASVDADALEAGARQRAGAYVAGIDARLKRLPFPQSPNGVQ